MTPPRVASNSRAVIGPPVVEPARGDPAVVGLGVTAGREYALGRLTPKDGRMRAPVALVPPGSPGSPPQVVAPSGAGKSSVGATQVPPSNGKSCRSVAVNKPPAVPAFAALAYAAAKIFETSARIGALSSISASVTRPAPGVTTTLLYC